MATRTVAEQMAQSLAFEVEAVPQNATTEAACTTNSTPLNVRIRVKKRDESGMQQGVLSVPKFGHPDAVPERIRLISSDQTIMSFDIAMEADFAKKAKRKPRRSFFAGCLGLQYDDDDDSSYLPSTRYSSKTAAGNVSSKSDGVIKQHDVLSKTKYDNSELQSYKRKPDILGKCKPGGCLDPPFGEEKYAYEPIQKQKIKDNTASIDEGSTPEQAKVKLPKRVDAVNFSFESKSMELQKSKLKTDDNSLLSLYKTKAKISLDSKYSDSVITYPPDIESPRLTNNDKNLKSNAMSDTRQRKSFNESIEAFFSSPRRTSRFSERSSNDKFLARHGKSNTGGIVSHTKKQTSPKNGCDILKTNETLTIDTSSKEGPVEDKIKHEYDKNTAVTRDTDHSTAYKTESQMFTDKVPSPITPEFKQKEANEIDDFLKYVNNAALTQTELTRTNTINPMLRTQSMDSIESKELNKLINQELHNIPGFQIEKQKTLEQSSPRHKYANNEIQDQTGLTEDNTINPMLITQLVDPKESKDLSNLMNQELYNIPDTRIDKHLTLEQSSPKYTNDEKILDMKQEYESIQDIEKQRDKFKDEYNSTQDNITRDIDINSQSLLLSTPQHNEQNKAQSIINKEYDKSGQSFENNYIEEPLKDSNFTSDQILSKGKHAQNNNLENDTTRNFYLSQTPTIDSNNVENKTLSNVPDQTQITKEYQNDDENTNEALSLQKLKDNSLKSETTSNALSNYEPNSSNKPSSSSISPPNYKPNLENEAITISSSNERSLQPKRSDELATKIARNSEEITKSSGLPNEDYEKEYESSLENLKQSKEATDYDAETLNLGDSLKSTRESNRPQFQEDDLVSTQVMGEETEKDLIIKSDYQNNPLSEDMGKQYNTSLHDNIARQGYSDNEDLTKKNTERGSIAHSSSIHSHLTPITQTEPDILDTPAFPFSSSPLQSNAMSIKSSKLRFQDNLHALDKSYYDDQQKPLPGSSSLKKDAVSLNLAFQSYVNDRKERTLKTIDPTSKDLIRYPNDAITVIQSQLRPNGNEIRIPVDYDNEMTIQLRRNRSPTHCVQILEEETLTEDGKAQGPLGDYSFPNLSNLSPTDNSTKEILNKIIGGDVQKVLNVIYEEELVPLQNTILSLKQEIDVILSEQSLLLDELCDTLKAKPVRLLRVNPRCGCWRK